MSELFPLRPLQQKAMDGLRDSLRGGHRRPIIQAPCGFGKCLGLGTQVMRFDGTMAPVEDIRAGDLLMGPDSLPRAVLSTARGSGQLYRIDPVKGSSWVCNDVHVLTLVETASGDVIDIPLNDYLLKSKTFCHTHKLFAPECGVDFATGNDPDIDPYFAGIWVGDGTKALRGVAISKPDPEILETITDVAAAYGGRVRTDGPASSPTHHIHFGRGRGGGGPGNPILNKLRDLFSDGLFPHEIKVSSRWFRQEFLAGVIDTDGYVARGCVEIAQKNERYADAIEFIGRSLGLRVTRTVKVVNGNAYQRMGLSGDFKGIRTRIQRKKISARVINKVATRTGFSVTRIGIGDYAGFELTGDGRFLLGDFTVTHNTVLAAHVVMGALAKQKRVAFVVPMLNLVCQTLDRFFQNGIDMSDMGVMQGDHPHYHPNNPIQICSVQTLASRGVPEVDFVVQDECHIRYKIMEEWIKDQPKKIFVGLSATPWSKGLGDLFDDLIIPTSINELIDNDYLSPFRAFAAANPDLSGIKTIAGEFHEGELSERMSQPKIVGDVVQTWLDKANWQPTLVFAVDRAHADLLHRQFEKACVHSAYVDANTPREERAEIARKLNAKELEVVVSINTMTTGVDLDVRCISDAAPTKSDIRHVQKIGRGLRIAPGKDELIVLDHAGNHLRLGMVTEINHDTLRSGKETASSERKAPLPKECHHCHYMVPVGASACPNCGYKRERVCGIEAVEGELIELELARKLKRKTNEEMTWAEKARFFGELKAYGKEMGYKEGWPAMKYKARCGVWPNDPRVKYAVGSICGPATRSWIRSQQIAWAKIRPKRSDDEIIRESLVPR